MTKMFELTVEQAAKAAYDEDTNMIVGKIDDKWQYAHEKNDEMIAKMEGDTLFLINSSGIVK